MGIGLSAAKTAHFFQPQAIMAALRPISRPYHQGPYIDKDTGLVPVMHARGTSGSAKRI